MTGWLDPDAPGTSPLERARRAQFPPPSPLDLLLRRFRGVIRAYGEVVAGVGRGLEAYGEAVARAFR